VQPITTDAQGQLVLKDSPAQAPWTWSRGLGVLALAVKVLAWPHPTAIIIYGNMVMKKPKLCR